MKIIKIGKCERMSKLTHQELLNRDYYKGRFANILEKNIILIGKVENNKKMLITLIACPNGMGHFQRLLKLSLSLKSKNKINLLCSKKQIKKINLKNFKTIKIRPILPEINLKQNPYEKLLKFYNKNFLNYRFFKDSEFIISDNLINKCFYKKKFLIISNFFWSEITKKKTISRNKYLKIENDFIKKKKIFSNRYFCTKKAKRIGSKYNFIEQDNYDLKKTKPKKKKYFYLYWLIREN